MLEKVTFDTLFEKIRSKHFMACIFEYFIPICGKLTNWKDKLTLEHNSHCICMYAQSFWDFHHEIFKIYIDTIYFFAPSNIPHLS